MAAIYPPAAQMLFWINAKLTGGTLWGWKLILLLSEVRIYLGCVAVFA